MAEQLGTINLSNSAEEEFNIVIDENIYILRQLRNTLGFWTLSVSDQDGNPLVYSVKLVAGSFVFEPYANVPFDLFVPGTIDPTRDNLDQFEMEIWTK